MNLIERTQAVLLKPAETLKTIKDETTTIGDLYLNYLIPLAAIPPVAKLIGFLVFYHFGFSSGLIVSSVVWYALSLACIFVAGKIINALAPNFGGTKNDMGAFRVVAYASTPMFVAGVFWIIPRLGGLAGVGGLYGIYLLYLALGTLMASPPEKVVGYTVVCVIVMIVLGAIVGEVYYQVLWGGSQHITINIPRVTY